MARSERFELPTLGIEIRCSIQLSYERVLVRMTNIRPQRLPDTRLEPAGPVVPSCPEEISHYGISIRPFMRQAV